MRPTWLERKRGWLLSQGLTNLVTQPTIFVTFSWWFGPHAGWGMCLNLAFYLGGATALALWAVGYRRYRIRMRAVTMYLLTNGLEEHGVYGLYAEGIIDYKTLKRLVPENVILTPVTPRYPAPWWKVWA